MDLDYWTRQRTDRIRLFYDKARVPFERLTDAGVVSVVNRPRALPTVPSDFQGHISAHPAC
jgi:hypothetical protein